MASYNIVVFGGERSGPEVVVEAVKTPDIVKWETSSTGVWFNLQDHLLGGCSIDAHGTPLTDAALEAAKAADAVLLGAIGGPEWGTGAVRPEQGILRLHKEMGTYGNLQLCFFPAKALVEYSPLKAEPCSRAEIERITPLAAHLALARSPPAPVRLWRKVVTEAMKTEFPQLQLHHQLIDSTAMIMVKTPRGLNGVVVTSNLFGDIISDGASVIPGSIGLSPSASLSGIPDGKNRCNGIYEPIRETRTGSAPDISGQGTANPIGTVLSVAMMCRYSLRLPKEADAIEKAVEIVLDGGSMYMDSNITHTEDDSQ
ncbi:3-isopropylmalate dehydrogenase [Nemania diffusa]|nr:3-isopropylmalate dehydrogenase [Nemania diffusa]